MLIQGFRIRSIAVRASGAAAAATDEYFNLVALLLPGNGTNGAQNNTFLDSSTNAFTITRAGNTTQGTFSPFGQTGWSNYFDGSGDYISAPDNAALEFGSGDFTIEAWIYLTAYSASYSGFYGAFIVSRDTSGARSYNFAVTATASSFTGLSFYNFDGSGNANLAFSASATINLNTWYHVAVSRSSTTFRLFLNGTLIGTTTSAVSVLDTATPTRIGSGAYSGFEYYTAGYISNVRIVKGTAVYTAAFTPSTTPLTAISGTSLLTCQSNRFIDNSTNAFAITAAGNTSVQSFAPFDPAAAYSAETVGGSAYFDGSGDYLSTPNVAALRLGAGDFTVEAWIYPNRLTNTYSQGICGTYGYVSTQDRGWLFYLDAAGYLQLIMYGSAGAGFTLTSSTLTTINTWSHVAATRSGTTVRLFLNGVQVASGTSSKDEDYTVVDFNVATSRADSLSPATGNPGTSFQGNISNLRLVKGTAIYTSAFTPPTAPVTAIANTSLLLNYTNAGITDAAAKNVLETVGNAGISTTQSKWGGSAMAFDGSGDYLTFPIRPLITSLGPTYTIEAWIYLANTTGVKAIYSTSVASTANYGYFIFYVTGSSLAFYNRAATGGAETGIVAGTLSANTWTHVAISVNSNSGRLYINGTQVGSTTTINTTTFTPVYNTIGADILQGYNFNGYINDLRITPGLARYTANFTPPTAAFPTQ